MRGISDRQGPATGSDSQRNKLWTGHERRRLQDSMLVEANDKGWEVR